LTKFEKNIKRRERYVVHVMLTTVLSLLVVTGALLYWPAPQEDENKGLVFDARGQEVIQIEEIQQTLQEKKKPAPQIPAPPIIMPDDVVLDDLELEVVDTALTLEDPGTDTEVVKGAAEGNAIAARADSGPSPVRITVGEYTREAERKKVKAEIVVEVLVNERGRVDTARIVERFLLSKDQSEREAVAEVGYGLEESALDAAKRYIFSPARENNKRVSSYTTLTFRFGV
jgi:protein TonB